MAARREQSLPEVSNPKAGRDYFIGPTYEAGLMLLGTEVKALRLGRANIADAFIRISPKGPMLYHAHIAEYDFGNLNNHATYRPRKLLLKQAEIAKIAGEVQSGGAAIVPLKIYFKHGLAKCLLTVGKGKKQHDKRHDIKERDAKREISRALSRRR
ncbi:ssrA-binding protein [Opitutia bacterium]|jgi:SsrA-binding protein|nr:ssrA-binding protein [Opitutae bacterium]